MSIHISRANRIPYEPLPSELAQSLGLDPEAVYETYEEAWADMDRAWKRFPRQIPGDGLVIYEQDGKNSQKQLYRVTVPDIESDKLSRESQLIAMFAPYMPTMQEGKWYISVLFDDPKLLSPYMGALCLEVGAEPGAAYETEAEAMEVVGRLMKATTHEFVCYQYVAQPKSEEAPVEEK